MEERQFDHLARSLGAATSRRQVLKLLGGTVAGAALGLFRTKKMQASPLGCSPWGDSCGSGQDDCCPNLACTPSTYQGGVSTCCPPDSDYFCGPRTCCLHPCPDGYERDVDTCDCVQTMDCDAQVTSLRACTEAKVLELGGFQTLPDDLVSLFDSFFSSLHGRCTPSSSSAAAFSQHVHQELALQERRAKTNPEHLRLFIRALIGCVVTSRPTIRGQCNYTPIWKLCDPPCGPCEVCTFGDGFDLVCVSDCADDETCQTTDAGTECVQCDGQVCLDPDTSKKFCTSDAVSVCDNETCCPADHPVCCPSDIGGCCPDGTTCIPGGCCPTDSLCSDGVTCRVNGTCCPGETPCEAGCCSSDYPVCCGADSAVPCCPSDYPTCIPPGYQAECCADGYGSCPPGYGGECCPLTAKCCEGGGCCDESHICCPGGCCADTDSCCGDGCCPAGTTCCTVNGTLACCNAGTGANAAASGHVEVPTAPQERIPRSHEFGSSLSPASPGLEQPGAGKRNTP